MVIFYVVAKAMLEPRNNSIKMLHKSESSKIEKLRVKKYEDILQRDDGMTTEMIKARRRRKL